MNDLRSVLSEINRLLDVGSEDSALALADQATVRYPEEMRVWSLRGHVYSLRGNYDAAIKDVTKAIDLNSMEPSLFFDRGRFELAMGHDRSAVEDFTRGLELCDHYKNDYYKESLHFMRAESFLRLGMKTKALSDLAHVRDDLKAWTYKLRTKAELLQEVNRLPG